MQSDDCSVVVSSFAIIAETASGHGYFRPSPLAILPNRPEASHLLIPLTPYKVAVIDREDSIRGNRGCRELAARLSSPCPQEQEPAHRKASDRLPSFKLADRCWRDTLQTSQYPGLQRGHAEDRQIRGEGLYVTNPEIVVLSQPLD